MTPPEPPRIDPAAPRPGPCLSEVKGQESAKRALEVSGGGGRAQPAYVWNKRPALA